MPEKLAKKVQLIGWDAADWKIINPLLGQGLMPTLEDLVNHGVIGNLATLHPVLSPMLWNSIATGMRPDKHGILGFIEPDPQTGRTRPVTSTSRKVKAIAGNGSPRWMAVGPRSRGCTEPGLQADSPAKGMSCRGCRERKKNNGCFGDST